MPTTAEAKNKKGHCAAPQTTACEGLYKGLFDTSPISLWEEDASDLKAYLNSLRRSGKQDIRTYLEYHPEEVARCANMVKVLAVNAASVKLFEAEDGGSLLANLDKVVCEESYDALRLKLVAIATGETCFEVDTVNRTLKGNKKPLRMIWSVAPGYESTYERAWVSMVDLSEREFFAKELDHTDRRYRTFAEYVNDVIYVTDMGLNFTFVSPSVERSLGYSVEEILGMHFRDLLTPASLEVSMAAVAEELAPEAMRKRDPRRFRVVELEFVRRDGSTLWGEVNISFMLDKDSIPTGIVGVIRDVTDRHVTREALERSWQAQKVVNDLLQISLSDVSGEEMLRRMLSYIVDIPWFSPNAQGAILLTDPGSETLVMKVESGLAGESFASCARRRLGDCLCGAAAASGEIMYRAGGEGPGGRRCQVAREHGQYCIPFASAGQPVGVLNLYVDKAHTFCKEEMEFLTAIGRVLATSIVRREAFDTLRKSEASYRATFDMAIDSIFIHDAETAGIIDVNAKACELFGFNRAEALALDIASISAPDSALAPEEIIERVRRAASEGPQVFDWRFRDTSGRAFWAEVNLCCATLGSGDRVLAFVREIDSRKRAEERVLQLRHFLEGTMDAVGIWVSGADTDGNILVWNATAEAISGYSREDVIGSTNAWKLMYPEGNMREKYMAERWAMLRGGVKCDRHKASIVTSTGDSRLMYWNYYPLLDGAGNLCGAIALAFDITEGTVNCDSIMDPTHHEPDVVEEERS